MRRRIVEVIVQFLNVFAVVAFVARQPEQPLFQDRVFPIPEGNGEAQPLFLIGNTRDAIFAPAVGPRSGVVVREILQALPCGL